MSEFINLTAQQLRQAAGLKERITDLEAKLVKLLGASGQSKAAANSRPARKKHKMSAAGKARIAAAQRKRWAKVKADKK